MLYFPIIGYGSFYINYFIHVAWKGGVREAQVALITAFSFSTLLDRVPLIHLVISPKIHFGVQVSVLVIQVQ